MYLYEIPLFLVIMNGQSSTPLIISSVSNAEQSCFLKWVQSFNVEMLTTCHSQGQISELWHMSDGVCVNKILNDVYPQRAFKLKDIVIRPTTLEECRRNLEACIADIKLFFREIIESGIHVLDMPDIDRIIGLKDEREIVKLLILLLCCVVHSEKKEVYVKRILTFETVEKQLLMVNIERLMYTDEDDNGMVSELHTLYTSWLSQLETLNKENKELSGVVEKVNREKEGVKNLYEKLVKDHDLLVEELDTTKSTYSLEAVTNVEMQKNERRRLLEEM